MLPAHEVGLHAVNGQMFENAILWRQSFNLLNICYCKLLNEPLVQLSFDFFSDEEIQGKDKLKSLISLEVHDCLFDFAC